MTRPKPTVVISMIGLLAACSVLAGCNEDKRLAEMAEENSRRQAEQSAEMAHLNREVAAGSKRLIAANAAANDKLLTAQQKLDDQRVEIDSQRQALASERTRESILGPLITKLGTLLVCALPLVLCWYLLHGLRKGGQEADISQLLIEEMAAERPTLLPPPPGSDAISQHDLPALENEPRSTS